MASKNLHQWRVLDSLFHSTITNVFSRRHIIGLKFIDSLCVTNQMTAGRVELCFAFSVGGFSCVSCESIAVNLNHERIVHSKL